jgi:hypothetical protein
MSEWELPSWGRNCRLLYVTFDPKSLFSKIIHGQKALIERHTAVNWTSTMNMGKGINETKRGKTNDFLLVISGAKSVPGTDVPITVSSKKSNSKALSRQVVLLGVSRKRNYVTLPYVCTRTQKSREVWKSGWKLHNVVSWRTVFSPLMTTDNASRSS